MTALLFLATLVARLVLAVVILVALAAIAWLLWDCTVGPSAREARARVLGVHGR